MLEKMYLVNIGVVLNKAQRNLHDIVPLIKENRKKPPLAG